MIRPYTETLQYYTSVFMDIPYNVKIVIWTVNLKRVYLMINITKIIGVSYLFNTWTSARIALYSVCVHVLVKYMCVHMLVKYMYVPLMGDKNDALM